MREHDVCEKVADHFNDKLLLFEDKFGSDEDEE